MRPAPAMAEPEFDGRSVAIALSRKHYELAMAEALVGCHFRCPQAGDWLEIGADLNPLSLRLLTPAGAEPLPIKRVAAGHIRAAGNGAALAALIADCLAGEDRRRAAMIWRSMAQRGVPCGLTALSETDYHALIRTLGETNRHLAAGSDWATLARLVPELDVETLRASGQWRQRLDTGKMKSPG